MEDVAQRFEEKPASTLSSFELTTLFVFFPRSFSEKFFKELKQKTLLKKKTKRSCTFSMSLLLTLGWTRTIWPVFLVANSV